MKELNEVASTLLRSADDLAKVFHKKFKQRNKTKSPEKMQWNKTELATGFKFASFPVLWVIHQGFI